jgi:hypothetical protein
VRSSWVIVADDKKPCRCVRQFREGFENARKALVVPVVPNQKKYEIVVAKMPDCTRLRAARESRRRRKLYRIDAVGYYPRVSSSEIFFELAGSARGNARKSNFRIAVDSTFQSRQESVVQAAMKPSEPTGTGRFSLCFLRQFPEAMKDRMNHDYIRVQTVYSRRKNEIAGNPADPAVPSAAKRIQQNPPGKLQQMRTWNGRNSVP